MTKYIRYIFFFALITLAVSCKKKTPENIGLPFIPGEDLLNAAFTDTLTLVAHTVKDDSLPTNKVTPLLLGNINDPIFGITQSSIFTQFSLSKTSPDFGTNPVLDSAVLSLVYNNTGGKGQYYGTLYPQKFDVYELSEAMSSTATYYSDTLMPYYTTQQIGSKTITLNIDSIDIGDTLPKYPPHLRVTLSKEMFQNFLDKPVYTSSYSSNDNFKTVFRGIYVVSSANTPSGEGAILYMNMTNAYSRITLYYKNDSTDSLYYYFRITTDEARFSHFDHDYSMTTDVQNQLNTADNIPETKVFVQPMAGVRTKITMPYISDLFKNGKISINKAELILPVDPNSITTPFTAHAKLVATIADSTYGPVIMPDYFEGATYFGGDYDSTKKEYRFNIARYVQQVLNGTRKNQGLYIITNARPTTANRVQLMGGNALTNRMRLKISYTPLE